MQRLGAAMRCHGNQNKRRQSAVPFKESSQCISSSLGLCTYHDLIGYSNRRGPSALLPAWALYKTAPSRHLSAPFNPKTTGIELIGLETTKRNVASMAFPSQPSGAEVRGMMEAMEHERGAFVVGIFFQTCLLGIAAAQTTAYFRRGSQDPIYFKVLLIFVVSVLSVKSLMNLKTVYATCLFARYGNRTPPPFPWTDRAAIVLNDVPLIAAQFYLSYRLWIVSLKRVLPTLLALLFTLASLTSFIIFSTNVVAHSLGKKEIPRTKAVWLPGWALCLCITDVYLSVAFAYYSLQTRKKAVGHRLDYMLIRLASLAITTCIPPAIVSAVMAILEISNPSGRSWNFCTVILGALYTVCILHALNVRHQILAEARSRSTMKNGSSSVTGRKDPSSSLSSVATKLALRSKKNADDQTSSGTESAKHIYSIELH